MAHMENKAKAAAMAPKATVPAPEKSDKKAKNQKK
jgi:hypothetical protein